MLMLPQRPRRLSVVFGGEAPEGVPMGEWVGTRADLARLEICVEVEHRFGVTFTDADVSGWRTAGDIYRALQARAGAPRDTRADWERLGRLLSQGYDVPMELVTAEVELFGDPLRLDERGPPRWPAALADPSTGP